jgi:hypothetical protein
MARATPLLIAKLREAASKIEDARDYNWGHIGRCNCGHLVQCLTDFSAAEIFSMAQKNYVDEWSEFANDYCPNDGASVDQLMDVLFAHGFELKDIHQLEYLSNPEVLKAIPGGPRTLEKGKPENAALYMRTWAALLEMKLKGTKPTASPRANKECPTLVGRN